MDWYGGKRFFITSSGHYGFGPAASEENDRIVIFQGATMPMLVRPAGESYRLLGPAVIHGIMNGEAWLAGAPGLEGFVLI
jgi:hypothetical protein